MAQHGRAAAPPYVGFRTFMGFLDWLIDERIVLPSRLDRSFWGQRLSGSSGPQLMGALRFLGLMDENNRPQPELEEMARDRTPQRERCKTIMREILPKSYGRAFEGLDLKRASADQFREHFSRYSVDGETRRKAVTFFVNAADYAGIPLSPHITRKAKGAKTNGAKKRARVARKHLSVEELPSEITIAGPTQGYDLHPSLKGLLTDLEHFGRKWTKEEQDQWLGTFISNFRYVYQVKGIQLDMRWP